MPHDAPRSRRRRDRLRSAGLPLLALAAWATSAGVPGAEAYRLQPGDVIEMSVAGLPDFGARAAVQLDGSLSLPLTGTLSLAGATVEEAREQIQTAVASRVLPVYLPDGRETTRAVRRDQVSAAIVEYRPVFVSGDVQRPGEMPFRPGMTVRQVLAAAGGPRDAEMRAPSYDPIALRADYATAWNAAASAAARSWRLRAELGTAEEFDRASLPPAPGPGDPLAEILRLEESLRTSREADHARERAYLEKTLAQIGGQAQVLGRQLEVEKENERADQEALATAQGAASRGAYTASRLADIRGAALISATRRLQTESNLMQIERRRTEVQWELDRLDDRRDVGVLLELQTARLSEAQAHAELRGAGQKLRAAGLPAPRTDADPGQPQIFRVRGDAAPEEVYYDDPLRPGDVLDVIWEPGGTGPLLMRSASVR